jgi:hypothetical protein
LHQVVVHLLCVAFDERLRRAGADRAPLDRVAGLTQRRDG